MDAIANGQDGEYDELFACKLGENHDLPLQPIITHVPTLTVDDTGNAETQGLLVDMSTPNITGGTLVAKFHLGNSRGKDCIQVVIPTSHETCAKQETEIEKTCDLLNWKDENRAKARKKTNLAIRENGEMDHVNNYAFEMPTVTSSTGKALKLCRTYFHETDAEPEGCTRLRVARKIVPGDITQEGQYVDVKGYGKVPLSLAHFSFQLAFEDTEQKIKYNDGEDADADESDEDLADLRKANA